jgi:tRNA dimethylallyltransferase
MLADVFGNALVLTGPTASGKTALGLQLAERLNAEIVCMDSMTLYRGMDVGTAKPTADERRQVPHHLLDVLDPWESASVAWWLERAAECCRDIEARGKRVLFVGGTPLYLKAILHGLFAGPPADASLRQRLEAEAASAGPQVLHQRLASVDPAAAARLHVNDLRRVVRALEVWELTGQPISAWQTQWPAESRFVSDHNIPARSQSLRPRVLALDLPRDILYARINTRVEQMIAAGLGEEGRALRRLPRPLSKEASQALGYKEMFEHLEGRASLEETVRRIQTRSRQLAKRQRTWFRHLPECEMVTPQLTFAALGLTMSA